MIKVLLVEDNPIVQFAQKGFLEKLNCQVDLAATGNDAIEMATNGKEYDIFFIDIGLPDIEGYQVVKKIRQHYLESNPSKPIVVLTGFVDNDVKERCIEAGANKVNHKPISIEDLEQLLNHYCFTQN